MCIWEEVASEFEVDGSLRDIYIFDVGIEEWNSLLSKIPASNYDFEYLHGEIETSLPDSFEEVKAHQQTDPTTLKIYLPKKVQVNCHFFTEDEIEFDVRPLEVDSSAKYSELISFMGFLKEALNRKVTLTHENSRNEVISTVY